MRGRIKTLLAVVILLVGALIVFLLYQPKPAAEDEVYQVSAKQIGNTNLALVSEDEEPYQQLPAAEAAVQKAAEYRELRSKGNVEIVFYGKVIDQNAQGISNCQITFQYSGSKLPTSLAGSDTFEYTRSTSSDSSGSFTIDDIEGRSLRILDIEKEGYILQVGGDFSFTYGTYFGGRHTPLASDPVLFRMAELDNEAVLLAINERLDVAAGQDEIILPLRIGSSDESLKLKFSFDRSENSQSGGYDWSYSVQLINGTIQEADGGTLLQAPQNGYIEKVSQEYDASSTSWTMRSQKLLYLKPKNSSAHAGIELTVFSYKDGRSRIIINGNLNLDGRLVVAER